jgi:hypothetical protein
MDKHCLLIATCNIAKLLVLQYAITLTAAAELETAPNISARM